MARGEHVFLCVRERLVALFFFFLSIEREAKILYNQAILNEGSQLEDPVAFSKQIAELMLNA